MLPHAPGVQMQAIPEDAIPEESGDEDEEDPDKRISSKTETQGPLPSYSAGSSDFPPLFLAPHSPQAAHLLRNPSTCACRDNLEGPGPLPLVSFGGTCKKALGRP